MIFIIIMILLFLSSVLVIHYHFDHHSYYEHFIIVIRYLSLFVIIICVLNIGDMFTHITTFIGFFISTYLLIRLSMHPYTHPSIYMLPADIATLSGTREKPFQAHRD